MLGPYRYFTPQEIDGHVREVERQLDERAEQEAEQLRFAAWVNDPRNKSLVKQLHAMPQPSQPAQHGAPVQRTVAPTPAVAPPTGYKSRAQLEREKPWLRDPKPQLESIIDPQCGKPVKPAAERRLGSPGIPPNGFWVL